MTEILLLDICNKVVQKRMNNYTKGRVVVCIRHELPFLGSQGSSVENGN